MRMEKIYISKTINTQNMIVVKFNNGDETRVFCNAIDGDGDLAEVCKCMRELVNMMENDLVGIDEKPDDITVKDMLVFKNERVNHLRWMKEQFGNSCPMWVNMELEVLENHHNAVNAGMILEAASQRGHEYFMTTLKRLWDELEERSGIP